MAKGGSSLISFVLLLIAVAVLAVVGFVAWSIAHEVGHKTRQKLEKKHVSFSRQGMKVGVKEVSAEQQEDATQRYYLYTGLTSGGYSKLTSLQRHHQNLEYLFLARLQIPSRLGSGTTICDSCVGGEEKPVRHASVCDRKNCVGLTICLADTRDPLPPPRHLLCLVTGRARTTSRERLRCRRSRLRRETLSSCFQPRSTEDACIKVLRMGQRDFEHQSVGAFPFCCEDKSIRKREICYE